MGCGMGLIDFVLSPFIQSITCVDQNPAALCYLEGMARARTVGNIKTICTDARDVQGHWDHILMVFYGRMDEHIERHFPQCEESIIAVVHADAREWLEDEADHPRKCNTVANTAGILKARNVRYTLIEDAIEYGQPFESREEAAVFAEVYVKCPPSMTMDAYLDKSLTHINHPKYPLYLPNLKRFGVFIIRREDNAHI